MIKPLLLLVTFLGCLSSYCFTQTLTNEQISRLYGVLNGYTQSLEVLSSCRGNNAISVENNLLSKNDGDNLNNYTCNDLFFEEIKDESPIQIGEYLRLLNQAFQYNIEVSFNNISIVNCTEKNGGYNFALMSANKFLKYKNESKSYTALFLVNLASFKVSQVTTPYFYKSDAEHHECKSAVSDTSVYNYINEIRTKADKEYFSKNYSNAEKLYTLIAEKNQRDLTVQNRIEECRTFISFNNLLSQAETKLATQNYQDAIDIYKIILNKFSNADKKDIESRIRQISDALVVQKYNYYMQQGDHALKLANFDAARINYNEALKYKPNDKYILSQIEVSKHKDLTYARHQIDSAVQLANEGKKNYGVAFKIMSEYESTGLLTTENYYFLVLMANSHNSTVKKAMNLGSSGFKYYFDQYLSMLKERNRTETDPKVTEKVNFLLEEIF